MRNVQLKIRLTPEEKKEWDKKARQMKSTLSDLVRGMMNDTITMEAVMKMQRKVAK